MSARELGLREERRSVGILDSYREFAGYVSGARVSFAQPEASTAPSTGARKNKAWSRDLRRTCCTWQKLANGQEAKQESMWRVDVGWTRLEQSFGVSSLQHSIGREKGEDGAGKKQSEKLVRTESLPALATARCKSSLGVA